MKKRILAILMVLAMAFTMLPLSAFAADTAASGTCGDQVSWTLDNAGTLTISGSGDMSGIQFKDVAAEHTINSAIVEKGVTSICYNAFLECTSLTSVELPDTITTIDYNAFNGCTSLTDITVPDSVTAIGDEAFRDCSSLTQINMPAGVTTIGTSLFSGCTSLKTVEMSSGVTEIFPSAFYSCISLETIALPDSLSIIGPLAFAECSGLTEIYIPQSVTEIGDSAFRNCSKLKSLSLPDGVSEIARDTLSGCTGLESVTMTGVSKIVYETFQSCTSLKDITLGSNLTSIGKDAFGECGSLSDVYYYGTEEQWKSIAVEDGNTKLTDAAIHYLHIWDNGVITTAATCTDDGVMTYTCTSCGETKNEAIAALGHDYSYTDNGDGSHTGVCSRCGESITEAHTYVDGICSDCGASLRIITQPQSVTAAVNASYSFTVEVEGDGLTYQWQYSTNGSTWTNSSMNSAKTAVLKGIAGSKYNGRLFRCVITDVYGNTVTSDSAVLTVASAPEITVQPQMCYVKTGRDYSFTVEATGDGMNYQWQYSKNQGTTWINSTTTSGKTAVLTGTASTSFSGRLYRCVITDSYGNTVTSDSAMLSVLGVKTQPADTTVADEASYQFTVKVSGEGLTYQWQYSTNGSTWTNSNMNSAKTATLRGIACSKYNGRLFRCKITDGAGNTVTSKAAVLTVSTTLQITAQPVDMVAAAGVSYSYTVTASGVGLTYQWQYSKDNGSTWTDSTMTCAKTETITGTVRATYNGRLFRCVITDAFGNTLTSDSAKLTVG